MGEDGLSGDRCHTDLALASLTRIRGLARSSRRR